LERRDGRSGIAGDLEERRKDSEERFKEGAREGEPGRSSKFSNSGNRRSEN